MKSLSIRGTKSSVFEVLRKHLRHLNEKDSNDIVEEIRSHILDKAASAGEITADSVASAWPLSEIPRTSPAST